MIESLLSLMVALLLVWISMPLTRWLGNRFGIVDSPNPRKMHQQAIPCSGGVAIYLAFFMTLFFLLSISPQLYQEVGPRIIIMSSLGALLLLLGIYDDKKNIGACWKLLGQAVICLMAIWLGFRIDILSNPFGGAFHLGWLAIPVTLFWFLGFINAMNLIDGLDGLATGIVAITSLVVLAMALVSGSISFAVLLAALAGASLSFLRINLSQKGKVFLGDNGSMLLGFLLASLAIIGSRKGLVFNVLIITVLCLGVPVYDTATAIARRLRRGLNIFSPDKEHVHHRLLGYGFDKRKAVLLLFGITLGLGLIGIALTFSRNTGATAILVASGSIIAFIKRKWWISLLRRIMR
jgi:UDP-GlcNAc:undecaprenyl-phosphate GlcNAc-1-phosphate transferase